MAYSTSIYDYYWLNTKSLNIAVHFFILPPLRLQVPHCSKIQSKMNGLHCVVCSFSWALNLNLADNRRDLVVYHIKDKLCCGIGGGASLPLALFGHIYASFTHQKCSSFVCWHFKHRCLYTSTII